MIVLTAAAFAQDPPLPTWEVPSSPTAQFGAAFGRSGAWGLGSSAAVAGLGGVLMAGCSDGESGVRKPESGEGKMPRVERPFDRETSARDAPAGVVFMPLGGPERAMANRWETLGPRARRAS